MGVPPLTAGPPLVLAPVDAVVCVTGADGVRAGRGGVGAEGAVGAWEAHQEVARMKRALGWGTSE
jgi:hypothetical protein